MRFRSAIIVGVLAVFAAVAAPTVAHSRDLDCKDFTYQQDAQKVYEQDTSDPNRLDADHDGIACEDLPSRPASSSDDSGSTSAGGTTSDDGSQDAGAAPKGGVETGAGGTANGAWSRG